MSFDLSGDRLPSSTSGNAGAGRGREPGVFAAGGRDEVIAETSADWLDESCDQWLETPRALRLPLFLLLGLIAAIIIRPWDFVPALASLKPVTLSILGITGLLVVGGQRVEFFRLPLARSLLVVWIVMLLGVTNPYQAGPVIDFAVKYVQFLILFGLIGTLVVAGSAFSWTHRVLCAVSVVLGVLAVKARLAGEFSIDGRIEGLGEGLLGDPNDLASMLVTLVPLVWFHTSTEESWFDRMGGFAALVALLVGIVITESRGGLLALIAAAGWLLLTSRAATWKKVGVILVVASIGVALLPDSVAQRYASITSAARTDESAQSRVAVWMAGGRIFQDHPLLGVGVTNFEVVYGSRYIDRAGAGDIWRSAHNSVVEAAAELGVVGLVAWSIFMFGPIALLWRARSRLSSVDEEIDLDDSVAQLWEDATDGNRWHDSRRLAFWSECMMASIAGFLVAAMFLSKAFDISTVIFVGLAVAGTRWIHRAADLREDALEFDEGADRGRRQ